MPCWDMTETARMGTFLTTQHYEATSLFGGVVVNIPRVRCTAGRLRHAIKPQANIRQDALVVVGSSCVSATLWKLYVLILVLILMSKRMVSLLLK